MVLGEPLPLPVTFASDVHWPLIREYQGGRPFLAFLDSLAQEGGTLILLGDVFDFWYEWRHVVPAYWFELFHRLRNLIERGVGVWFIVGNHDFHPGNYLEKEVGLNLCRNSLDCQAGGRRFFVAHGDGLAQRDGAYRLLKQVIRHPLSNWFFSHLLHPDWGMSLARWTSLTSRKHRQIDKEAWSEEYFQFARGQFALGYDHVVLGHLHLPVLKPHGAHSYLNCGDWISDYSYGRFDGQELTLQRWPVS